MSSQRSFEKSRTASPADGVELCMRSVAWVDVEAAAAMNSEQTTMYLSRRVRWRFERKSMGEEKYSM
jgi:hypothetical protein